MVDGALPRACPMAVGPRPRLAISGSGCAQPRRAGRDRAGGKRLERWHELDRAILLTLQRAVLPTVTRGPRDPQLLARTADGPALSEQIQKLPALVGHRTTTGPLRDTTRRHTRTPFERSSLRSSLETTPSLWPRSQPSPTATEAAQMRTTDIARALVPPHQLQVRSLTRYLTRQPPRRCPPALAECHRYVVSGKECHAEA